MPKKNPHLLMLDASDGVLIQCAPAVNAALAAALGYTIIPTTGTTANEVPAGKRAVAKGRIAALEAGAVAVVLTYNKSATLQQSAKVLISPTKVTANIFTTLKDQKYSTFNITKVQVPRRRVWSY